MLYCTKCQAVTKDAAKRCPGCHSAKLRPAGERDMVLLQGADMYTAQQVAQRLMEQDIPCETKSAGHAYFSFDNQSLPTDQNLYVPFAHLSAAQELAAQVGQELEQERNQPQEDPGPASAKHIFIEVLSVAAFLALIALASLGADALTSWLKTLL